MATPYETIAAAARLVAAGQPARAAEELRRALRHHPNDGDLHHELGVICMQAGQGDQALFHLQRAAALAPKRPDFHSNLGTVLNIRGKPAEAVEAFRRAVALNPRAFPAQLGLSSALIGIHDYEAAAEAARAAATVEPNRPEPVVNGALAVARMGRTADAVAALRAALEQQVDQPLLLAVLSNLLLSRPEADAAQIREVNERLGRALAALAPPFTPIFPDTSEHRLRVGYLTCDARDHAVSHFLAPILRNHDRAAFEVFLYAAVPAPDAVTQSLAAAADHAREVAHASDGLLAELIRRDRIDILVDLSGHNPGSRIGVFTHRAAPVQVAYLGYPATTGVAAIRSRITDGRLDPDGADSAYTESLVRIEAPCLAYDVPPAPKAPARNGPPTFAVLAPPHRFNESLFDAWAAILKAAPGTHLLFKSAPFTGESARAAIRRALADRGVEEQRLAFQGYTAGYGNHLAAIAKADIALDTFPAAGLASTADALACGLPVVTLAGSTHAGRLGVDLLTAAGCEELIARSVDDYIRIAADLARDDARLGRYRAELPGRLASSPLADAKAVTRRLEQAYRTLWEQSRSSIYYAPPAEGLPPDLPEAAVVDLPPETPGRPEDEPPGRPIPSLD